MLRTLKAVRLVVSILVLVLGGLILGGPGMLRAQWEDPCEFGGPPGSGWECDPDKAHIYQGSCEGIDCYTQMEDCCGKPVLPGG